MRLLFERGFAPTHAFSAFYRYLREDFGANAVLHFGTHGALEFMPGKQVGLTADCWPERLIGDLPNYYLYAANNPSEGALAKRRSGATLISYLTPPIANAGLYKGLLDLKSSIQRWRGRAPGLADSNDGLDDLIHEQAAALDLATAPGSISEIAAQVQELEHALIPSGRRGRHLGGAHRSLGRHVPVERRRPALARGPDRPRRRIDARSRSAAERLETDARQCRRHGRLGQERPVPGARS
jgi:hypothetical protein